MICRSRQPACTRLNTAPCAARTTTAAQPGVTFPSGERVRDLEEPENIGARVEQRRRHPYHGAFLPEADLHAGLVQRLARPRLVSADVEADDRRSASRRREEAESLRGQALPQVMRERQRVLRDPVDADPLEVRERGAELIHLAEWQRGVLEL